LVRDGRQLSALPDQPEAQPEYLTPQRPMPLSLAVELIDSQRSLRAGIDQAPDRPWGRSRIGNFGTE